MQSDRAQPECVEVDQIIFSDMIHAHVVGETRQSTYNRYDGRGDVRELDTALVQSAHQQLAVLASVILLYSVVCLHHFLLQQQHHLVAQHGKPSTLAGLFCVQHTKFLFAHPLTTTNDEWKQFHRHHSSLFDAITCLRNFVFGCSQINLLIFLEI